MSECRLGRSADWLTIRRVVMEVYSGTRHAVPRRGALMACALLVGASLLAGRMVHNRGGVRLAPLVQLDGWTLAFSAPVGFELRSTASYERWQMAFLVGPVEPSELIRLLIWERSVEPGIRSDMLADAVLRMSAALLGREVERSRTVANDSEPLIGRIPASEVWSPSLGIAARAAVSGDMAYAVSMAGRGAPISASAYDRFDACCRSIATVGASAKQH